jgi:hypothetical protein
MTKCSRYAGALRDQLAHDHNRDGDDSECHELDHLSLLR